ncbi:hypothetical protein [Moorena sp. SIO3I6]|nr:hypothetical protein [Moorena sp. SIO3I6]
MFSQIDGEQVYVPEQMNYIRAARSNQEPLENGGVRIRGFPR